MAGTKKPVVAKAGPKAKKNIPAKPAPAKPAAKAQKKSAPKTTKGPAAPEGDDEALTAVFDGGALEAALDAAAAKNKGKLTVDELRDILAGFLIKAAKDESGNALSPELVAELVEALLVEIVLGSEIEDDEDEGDEGGAATKAKKAKVPKPAAKPVATGHVKPKTAAKPKAKAAAKPKAKAAAGVKSKTGKKSAAKKTAGPKATKSSAKASKK